MFFAGIQAVFLFWPPAKNHLLLPSPVKLLGFVPQPNLPLKTTFCCQAQTVGWVEERNPTITTAIRMEDKMLNRIDSMAK